MSQAAQQAYRPPLPEPSVKRLWLAVFLVATLLYALTCQRGVSWQDSGMFQYRAYTLDLRGQLGLALAHPLYIIAGWLLKFVPVADFPARLNFFSGLGMAAAAANLAAATALLTGRRWIALAVAVMLVVAHTAWWLATIAEVYTWQLAGFTAELWLLVLLVRRPAWGKLAALALINGLGLCVHNLALLPLPLYLLVAIVLIVRRRLPAWSLAAAAGAWIAGAGLYFGLIAVEIAGGAGVKAAIASALFGQGYADKVLNTAVQWGVVRKANFALMALNVVGAPMLLAAVGAATLRRRVGGLLAGVLWAIAGVHLLFVIRYNVPDQFTFFLPALAMFVLLAGAGLASLESWNRPAKAVGIALVLVWVLAMPLFYAAAPALVRAGGLELADQHALPYRSESRYWLTPWKHNEDSAERFARDAVSQLRAEGAPAFLYAPSTAHAPLRWVLTTEAADAPITLMGGWGDPLVKLLQDQPGRFWQTVRERRASVWVVSIEADYCPPLLRALAGEKPQGLLYRVTLPIRPATATASSAPARVSAGE